MRGCTGSPPSRLPGADLRAATSPPVPHEPPEWWPAISCQTAATESETTWRPAAPSCWLGASRVPQAAACSTPARRATTLRLAITGPGGWPSRPAPGSRTARRCSRPGPARRRQATRPTSNSRPTSRASRVSCSSNRDGRRHLRGLPGPSSRRSPSRLPVSGEAEATSGARRSKPEVAVAQIDHDGAVLGPRSAWLPHTCEQDNWIRCE